jgi:putative DNA primase/helicase
MSSRSDFNDLAQEKGLAAVSAAVREASPPDVVPSVTDASMPPPGVPAPDASSWPVPVLPGMAKTPDIPACLLPGWLGEMADAVAKSSQTPAAMAVMACLSILATVLQGRFSVSPKGTSYTEPLCLWTITALPSGSRKSEVMRELMAPLLSWEKKEDARLRPERISVNSKRTRDKKRVDFLLNRSARAKSEEDRARDLDEIKRLEEEMPDEVFRPRLIADDITAERLQSLLFEQGGRVAIFSSEGGVFKVMGGMYTGGSTNLNVFLQGHAGEAVHVDRAGREVHLDNAYLSFGMAIQPGILFEVIETKQFRDNGLIPRFLFAYPSSNLGSRDPDEDIDIPEDVRANYKQGIYGLLSERTQKPGKPFVLHMSPQARKLRSSLAWKIEKMLGEEEEGAFRSWLSKLPGAAMRIAALLEICEKGLSVTEVSEYSMNRAFALSELLIQHALAVLCPAGADESDAGFILKWIITNNLWEFSKQDCRKANGTHFRKGGDQRLTKALNALVTRDVLRHHRGGNGPRKSDIYTVNPRVPRP